MTAPETDEAPTCWTKLPTCTATMTPNGMDTSNAGIAVTLMMNQAWLTVSRQGWRNLTRSVIRYLKDWAARSKKRPSEFVAMRRLVSASRSLPE